MAGSYEAAHARLAVEFLAATDERFTMLSEGKIEQLPAQSQHAADKSYLNTTVRLCEGLEQAVALYKDSKDVRQSQVYTIWRAAESPPD